MGANAVQGPQVDEDVEQGIEIGNGLTVAQLGAFNAKGSGLGVDTFSGSALAIDMLVGWRGTVEFVADLCTGAEGKSGETTPFAPIGTVDGTGLSGRHWEKQRASIASAFVGDETG